MLTIRDEQKDKWYQGDEGKFVEAILKRVRESHPTYRQTDDMLRDSIRVGLRRARSNGLQTDRHLSEFVLIMFEIAPNFDRQEDIRRALDDASMSPEQRWERLFTPEFDAAWDEADDPSFLDADAWFEHPPKDLSETQLPTEEEWAELLAAHRVQQQTPEGAQAREPTEAEIQQALLDIRARVNSSQP